MDRVSTAGYALGYLGGGLLLVASRGDDRASPTLRARGRRGRLAGRVPDGCGVVGGVFYPDLPQRPQSRRAGWKRTKLFRANPIRVGFGRLKETFGEVRQYRDLSVYLVAYWFFIDGIHSIPRLATIYGASLNIDSGALIGGIIVSQFVGIPFTFAFGSLANRIGAVRGIYVGLVGYVGITVLAMFVSTGWHFFALAVWVGMLQGRNPGALPVGVLEDGAESEIVGVFQLLQRVREGRGHTGTGFVCAGG